MSNTSKKPAAVLRIGAIKAAIWKNPSEKGDFYTVDISRTYTDDAGDSQNSYSFSGNQLLVVARISEKAFDHINDLKASQKSAA